MLLETAADHFSKFYGKVGVISWFLFHLTFYYVLYWDFDLKSWIVDFFTRFTQEKTPQNNFSSQNFSVENNYFWDVLGLLSSVIRYLSRAKFCLVIFFSSFTKTTTEVVHYSKIYVNSDGLNPIQLFYRHVYRDQVCVYYII